jgi:Holliday junction resolvase RusA-like endonuclease
VSELLAAFHAAGRARTKGSLKVITPRGRKPILAEDHALSKPWRNRMVAAIRLSNPEVNRADHVPYDKPVTVRATFVFERKGPSAQGLAWPVVNAGVNASGDIDKLLRNLLDALKDARLIADDCLVVALTGVKAWPIGNQIPGVYVEVGIA